MKDEKRRKSTGTIIATDFLDCYPFASMPEETEMITVCELDE